MECGSPFLLSFQLFIAGSFETQVFVMVGIMVAHLNRAASANKLIIFDIEIIFLIVSLYLLSFQLSVDNPKISITFYKSF